MNNIELKLIKEYVDKKVESGLPGAPGDSVVNVEKNQGNLIIYLSHYNTETGMNIVTPVNLGSIIGPQGDKGQHGDGYTSIQINNNGDLIATKEVYSAQGSIPAIQQINLGHVVGTDYVLTNEDKAEIAESINLSSKQDKAPDGDNLLIDSSTGKINAAYIPDSLLGQIIFGGTISNVEADAGDDLVLRVALSATAKNILHSNSNYYTLYPHGPEYNAADCANMFFIYDSPQVNMSFDNIGVLNSGDWVISTGDAWQKIDNTDSVTSVNGKIGNVVLKTSDLQNDSGFLTQHQDISNKADKATTLAGYGITDAYTKTQTDTLLNAKESTANKVTAVASSSTDTQYPSAKAVYTELSGKADKSNTYTKSEVDSLVSGGVVPQYVIDEAESVLSKAFSHNSSNKTIRFIAVSDGHNDATEVSHDYTKIANLHCGQAIKYIADRIPLDFVAFLGDMTWAGVSGETYTLDMVKQDIQEMNSFLAAGFKGIPNIRVIGNHDQCLCSGSRLQNKEAYNLIGRYNSGEKTFDNYGYYDLDFAKVRIIYLNTSEITNANSSNAGAILNISQNQKNWLAELLISTNQKTDANDWRILILSHAPLDMVGNIGTDILIPYTNGGSYNSYNFTNHNVEILGNIHGHVHCFSYGYISNKIRRFTIPNSNFYDNNHYRTISGYESWSEQTTYPKTANSRTDTSFSLVTMDLENDICYVDNYGAGIDRVFSLGYLKTATSISNISYSGPTTVGTVIDINNINYTLTYSDNSTSILSGGNITVSPSTISTVGNNTITISYSDGTSSLSDSITIIGTAIPVNNLLNLDRTFESLDAGVNITTALNENKAYTNISYGSGNADAKINSVANVTTDSITITEPGVGGIEVAFPIQLDPTKQYRLTYDYSGPGKVRGHARWWGASTGWTGQFGVYDGAGGNTAGASGTYTTVLPSHSGSYTWLIIMLGSNTSGTKTFSNVSLVEEVAN